MDKECRIILSKIMEYETSLRNDLAQSQAIRKCMKIAWDLHYKALFEKYEAKQNMDGMALLNEESAQKKPSKPSKASPVVGATMATLSENLDSGPYTATKKHSRRAS